MTSRSFEIRGLVMSMFAVGMTCWQLSMSLASTPLCKRRLDACISKSVVLDTAMVPWVTSVAECTNVGDVQMHTLTTHKKHILAHADLHLIDTLSLHHNHCCCRAELPPCSADTDTIGNCNTAIASFGLHILTFQLAASGTLTILWNPGQVVTTYKPRSYEL